jgi:hypothetical protein
MPSNSIRSLRRPLPEPKRVRCEIRALKIAGSSVIGVRDGKSETRELGSPEGHAE